MCRHELVIDATAADDESVIGDECHIVSGKSQGPRHDPARPSECLDELENLILLCRIHHKMVDDQYETYTVEMLKTLKANHEKWVSDALSDEKAPPPVRIRRIKENIPTHLTRLMKGREVMNIIEDSCSLSFEHDEPQSREEMEIISGFAQEVQDWGDLSGDFEAGQRVEAAYRMSAVLQELEGKGFWLFGGREIQRIEGGIAASSSWPVAILRVIRPSSPEITKIDLKVKAQQGQAAKKAPTTRQDQK
jgi:hypothetical protein